MAAVPYHKPLDSFGLTQPAQQKESQSVDAPVRHHIVAEGDNLSLTAFHFLSLHLQS